MKCPKSLTFLIFFASWSAFKGLESLIRPASSKIMFEEYSIGILYYLFVAIAILGGVAVVYAISKRAEWGYKVSVAWLISGIVYNVYTGTVSVMNKGLMEQIMITTREAKGRPTNGIAEYINSSAFDATVIVTTVVMAGLMLLFLWKIHKHKSFFKPQTKFDYRDESLE